MAARAVVFTACDAPEDIFYEDGRAAAKARWREQLRRYQDCPTVGLLYVFLTNGYRGVTAGDRQWTTLGLEQQMRTLLEEAIAETRVTKAQIVGVGELISVMGRLESMAHGQWAHLALGEGKYLYYDSPKMIEAIIRIARSAHFPADEELIFRIDADVAPNDGAFTALLDYYRTLPKGMCGHDHYFFFSGGYRAHREVDLLNDYAVRAHHFAPLGTRCFGRTASSDAGYLKAYDTAVQWLASLKALGTDVENQVISGAGLCMSGRAIRSLPPFANMNEAIIWIDDQLKRVLHEALGHLPAPDTSGDGHRHCAAANFEQERYPQGVAAGDIDWAKDTYLGRLVRGCLMQAAIEQPYREIVRLLMERDIRPGRDALEQRLRPVVQRRLDRIRQAWQAPVYRDYPVGEYAHGVLDREGDGYVAQVIDDLDNYLDLLADWPRFAALIENIDARAPANAWLFRPCA